MAQHDRVGWTREEAPHTDNWEDIQADIYAEEPLDASLPEPLWQLILGLGSQLLERHPLLLWSGIWVTLLLTAGIAVTELMDPELSAQKPLTSAVQKEAEALRASATSVEDPISPILLFGAIAISCGVGSLVLSQHFKENRSDSHLLDDSGNSFDFDNPFDFDNSFDFDNPDDLAANDLAADERPIQMLPKPIASSSLAQARPISPLALQKAISQTGGDRRPPLGLQSQPTVPLLPGITHLDITIMPGNHQLPLGDPHLSQAATPEAPGLEELMTIQQRRKGREVEP